MKNITDLRVTQIRVFAPDIIPMRQLMTETVFLKVKDRFKFAVAQPSIQQISPDSLVGSETLGFAFGEFLDDKNRVVIDNITIEPRKIGMRVSGTSTQADKVYDVLKTLISDFDQDKKFVKSKPIVKTDESSCSATLNIDLYDYLSGAAQSFLKNTLPKFTSWEQADSLVMPPRVGVKINYQIKDKSITDHGISLSPKEFVIEVRVGTPVEEQRFFTSSPTDTETHLKLLKEFETLFEKKEKPSRPKKGSKK
jgi:hypothetical protein